MLADMEQIVKAKLKADGINWEVATELEIKKALENVASPKKCFDAIMSARKQLIIRKDIERNSKNAVLFCEDWVVLNEETYSEVKANGKRYFLNEYPNFEDMCKDLELREKRDWDADGDENGGTRTEPMTIWDSEGCYTLREFKIKYEIDGKCELCNSVPVDKEYRGRKLCWQCHEGEVNNPEHALGWKE